MDSNGENLNRKAVCPGSARSGTHHAPDRRALYRARRAADLASAACDRRRKPSPISDSPADTNPRCANSSRVRMISPTRKPTISSTSVRRMRCRLCSHSPWMLTNRPRCDRPSEAGARRRTTNISRVTARSLLPCRHRNGLPAVHRGMPRGISRSLFRPGRRTHGHSARACPPFAGRCPGSRRSRARSRPTSRARGRGPSRKSRHIREMHLRRIVSSSAEIFMSRNCRMYSERPNGPVDQPRNGSLAACISRWPWTTRRPSCDGAFGSCFESLKNIATTDFDASFTCRKSGLPRGSISRITMHRVPTLPTPTTLNTKSCIANCESSAARSDVIDAKYSSSPARVIHRDGRSRS